jgi:hypothetical protein
VRERGPGSPGGRAGLRGQAGLRGRAGLGGRPLGRGVPALTGRFGLAPGVGDSALKGFQDGTDEVLVAQRGRVYVEIGPGDLKETRMINLAKLILGQVH